MGFREVLWRGIKRSYFGQKRFSTSQMAASGQVTVWDFTSFIPEDIDVEEDKETIESIAESIKSVLKLNTSRFVFQLECGSETERLHFQGRFHLTNRCRLTGLRKMFKESELSGAHFSATSSANRKNMFYVMKEETKVKGFERWMDKTTKVEEEDKAWVPRQLKDFHKSGWYPWQKEVYKKSKKFDTRSINVVVDLLGNIGKSTFITWMLVNKLALEVPPSNDFKDILQYLCSTVNQRGRTDKACKTIFIDFPRSIKQDKVYPFMAGIERIKDGRLYDMRYKATEVFIDSPNIWLSMNTIPELKYISRDRWVFWTIGPGFTLVRIPLWSTDTQESIAEKVEKIQEAFALERREEGETREVGKISKGVKKTSTRRAGELDENGKVIFTRSKSPKIVVSDCEEFELEED